MALADVIALRNHRPTILCWIDSRRVYGVRARINFSMRAKVATCTLTLKDRPDWLAFRQRVEVYLGYNGLTRKRFTGFVEDDGRRVWPYSKTITAAAYMRWTERKSPVEVTYASQGAIAIVTDLLTRAGVPFRSIGGDDTTLGTLQDVVLAKRQDYWSLIDQIDEPWLCRTFDWLPDGTVRRMQVSELPAAAAAAWAVYTYPGNVLSLDNPLTIKEIQNRVEVLGLEGVEAYRRADSPYVDPAHDEIYEVNSDLIETVPVAEAIALLQMPTRNRLVRRVVFRAAGNPLLNPGDTVQLTAAKVGISGENLWLEELDEDCGENGYWGQYSVTGGAGEAGYPIYPPIASFTIKVTREAFDAGAGVDVYYTVFCDGSASSSPSGLALTFDWSNDVTADVSSASTYSFRLTEAEYNGGCSVTLTVTDTAAEDDTLTLSVADAVGDEGPIIRTLYLARETEAEVTPDSGENWTTDAAVDAISTPEIAGEGHSYFGMATGALYHTDDALATKTLAHTFPDDVTCAWIHEVDANRVMAGCADGTVWTTSDADQLAAATWTQIADYASPVNWVVWGYDGVQWVLVGNQVIANGAVQWVLDAGYTATRLALSFIEHYASGTNGVTAQVKRRDGVIVTWPGGYSPVRCAIAHHILDDVLYAADDAGEFYAKAAGSDPPAFEHVSTIGGGECYHLLRDGTNALILWASCANGLYKTYDGGTVWYLMRAGKTLMAGYGSNPWAGTPVAEGKRVVIAGAGTPAWCKWTDDCWADPIVWVDASTGLPNGTSVISLRLEPNNNDRAYLLVDGDIYRNDDLYGAGSWVVVLDAAKREALVANPPPASSATTTHAFDVSLASAGVVYALVNYIWLAANNTMLLKSTDYGANWSKVFEAFLTGAGSWPWTSLAVGQHDSDQVYAARVAGSGDTQVWNPADGWVFVATVGYVRLTIPYASNPLDNVVFAFPTNGGVSASRKTLNGGTSWTILATNSPGGLNNWAPVKSDPLAQLNFVLSEHLSVYQSTDGGNTWTQMHDFGEGTVQVELFPGPRHHYMLTTGSLYLNESGDLTTWLQKVLPGSMSSPGTMTLDPRY